MKLIVAALALSLLAVWSSPALAWRQCFTDRRIVQINIGYVDNGQEGGPDGGDAVLLVLDDGRQFPLNKSYNLDWPRGQALHRAAMAAMTQRLRVTGHDHYGSTCDDIDELAIKG